LTFALSWRAFFQGDGHTFLCPVPICRTKGTSELDELCFGLGTFLQEVVSENTLVLPCDHCLGFYDFHGCLWY
jgi:hypothetical protein